MSHERKKGGERKDKKNERMRDDVAKRHAEGSPKRHEKDEQDIIDYKPGSQGDANRDKTPPPSIPGH